MLPSLPQYMIALLKILLAAAPTSKAKTDSINIMTDVLPEEMPMTVMQSMKLGRMMGFPDGFSEQKQFHVLILLLPTRAKIQEDTHSPKLLLDQRHPWRK